MEREKAGRRRHGPTICSKAKEMPILLEILMTRRQRAYIIVAKIKVYIKYTSLLKFYGNGNM